MAKARRLKPQEIEEIFRRFHDIEPEPKGELDSVNDFTFLVAVVLSAQATDMRRQPRHGFAFQNCRYARKDAGPR